MKSLVVSQSVFLPITVAHITAARVQISENDHIRDLELPCDVIIYIDELINFLRSFGWRGVNGNKNKICDIWKINSSKRKCSKVVGISSDIFGKVWKSSENRRKSSEVARTFSEIPFMTIQKSHAFDTEKDGRYMICFKRIFR